MRANALAVILSAALLSPFAVTPSVLAHGGGEDSNGSHGKSGKYELRAKLTPDPDPNISPEQNARGDAKYREQSKNGYLKKQELDVKVKIPFPSDALGIMDQDTAMNAGFQVILSRPSAMPPAAAPIIGSNLDAGLEVYAMCPMQLDEIEQEVEEEHGVTEIESEAEYRFRSRYQVKGRSRSSFRSQPALCTLMDSNGGTDGIPTVQEGDTIQVVQYILNVDLSQPGTQVLVVQGVFESKKKRH